MTSDYIKKSIVFMIMATVMLVVTGCNTKKDKEQSRTQQLDEKHLTYGSQEFISDDVEGDVDFLYVMGGEIYFNTYQQLEETNERIICRMYSANLDGSDVKEIPLIGREEDERLEAILVDQDKNMVYVLESYDEEGNSSFVIVKSDQQGKELRRKDITKDIGSDAEIESKNLLFDNNGRTILVLNKEIYVFDENYNFLCKFEVDENVNNVAITKEGNFICGGSNEKGAYVKELDIENRRWGEEIPVEIEYFNSSDCLINGLEYDFYYRDDSGIYGYTFNDKQSIKLIDYVASDINFEDSYGIVPIGQEQFVGIVHSNDDQTSIVKYSKINLSTGSDKTVIIYGTLQIDDDLKNAAIQFNKENKEYRIEFKDYSLEEDPVTKMNMDIITGNVPDIIDLSEMPVKQYVAKGMLEDLTPYFEKDTDIKENDIVDSVLNAMKIDGKLYYLAPSFSVSTVIASVKDVENETGWTFDDMKTLLEKKGSGVRPFYVKEKADVLYLLMHSSTSNFIDWDNGICSFESKEFKDILEFCNTESVVEDDSGYLELLNGGKVLFVEGSISVDEIQVFKKLYGSDITFIGYPNKEKEGSYFNFKNMTGIYSKSENKEGAWEFVRTLMLKEYQKNEWRMSYMPTRKDCFELKIKEKMATEKYIDEFGNEIQPIDSVWGYYDFQVQINPSSNEEVEMYRNLVNNTNEVGECNHFVMNIILEEAEFYFSGDKSLDEVVGIIQNRVNIYVNENR